LANIVTEKPDELIVDCVAKAIYEAERHEGHCGDGDSFASYMPAAKAHHHIN
jgi:hypothetical protein